MNNKFNLDRYDTIKEVYSFAYKSDYDILDFINTFIRSDLIEEIYLYYDSFFYNPYTIYKQIIEKYSVKKTNKNDMPFSIIAYIAYIYEASKEITNDSFKMISSYLSINNILENYEYYHIVDEEKVILENKIRYNIKQNPMRKKRGNNFLLPKDNGFYLYYGKRIYKYLFNYKYLNKLKYYFDDFPYLKKDEDCFITYKSVNDNKEIIEISNNDILSHYIFNVKDSILFLFLDKEITLDKNLKEKMFKNNKNHFSKIFILENNKIHFYMPYSSPIIFYLPINKVLINYSITDYKRRFINIDNS